MILIFQEQIDGIYNEREREKIHANNNHARKERIRLIKNLNKKKNTSGIKKLSFKRPTENFYMEEDDFNPRHIIVNPPIYNDGFIQGNFYIN